jgi:hypothetical protein
MFQLPIKQIIPPYGRLSARSLRHSSAVSLRLHSGLVRSRTGQHADGDPTVKAEVAPQIQRMDAKGTAAGERFSLDQGKELGRVEERLKELEKEARSIEAMKLKIDALERTTYATRPPKP